LEGKKLLYLTGLLIGFLDDQFQESSSRKKSPFKVVSYRLMDITTV